MVTLNTLKPAAGSHRKRSRVGRGQGSGAGCTAGRGYNGHSARSGSRNKAYFEGGQTPLTRRTPKRGFTGPGKNRYQIVNLGSIDALHITEPEITPDILYRNGLIDSPHKRVKILGGGTLGKNVTITADAYSKSAREKLKIPKSKPR